MRGELSVNLNKKNARIKRAKIFVFSAIALGLVLAAIHQIGYRLNQTPSYPLGIYKINKSDKAYKIGDLVSFCPPYENPYKIALDRGYISKGECAGNMPAFIKRVVAIEGDKFTITDRVAINGKLSQNSEIRQKDSLNRPLPSIESGTVKPNELFVLSEYSANSFDSRYYGPIRKEWVIGKTKPIWTYKPKNE